LKKAVVIEDFKLLAEEWKRILVSMDYDVTVFLDGFEITDKILAINPDIILTDINLKGENGLDISKELLKKNASLKIMAITLVDDKNSVIRAKQIGLKGYVLKGSSIKEICEKIKIVAAGETTFAY
jgi:DNA-binding NarL/FixJ family response regulator